MQASKGMEEQSVSGELLHVGTISRAIIIALRLFILPEPGYKYQSLTTHVTEDLLSLERLREITTCQFAAPD